MYLLECWSIYVVRHPWNRTRTVQAMVIATMELRCWSTNYWPSCVGGHKPKSFGSVGRCCGINDLLPTHRWHQNFVAMALGQTNKHLKKEKHMSFCRLLQNSLKRRFVITASWDFSVRKISLCHHLVRKLKHLDLSHHC